MESCWAFTFTQKGAYRASHEADASIELVKTEYNNGDIQYALIYYIYIFRQIETHIWEREEKKVLVIEIELWFDGACEASWLFAGNDESPNCNTLIFGSLSSAKIEFFVLENFDVFPTEKKGSSNNKEKSTFFLFCVCIEKGHVLNIFDSDF